MPVVIAIASFVFFKIFIIYSPTFVIFVINFEG
jgi:hypothetical protein